MTANERIYLVIHDPASSYWLINALSAAMRRDAVDAANDADVLATLLRSRCEESLGKV